MSVHARLDKTSARPRRAEDAEGEAFGAPLPHITVHVFSETPRFSAIWEEAAADPRMAAATTRTFEGGIPAAVARYTREPTPDLIMVETECDGEVLEFEVDALAEVCDSGTDLIVIGRQNDITLYQRLVRMGVTNYLVYPLTCPALVAAIAEIYASADHGKIGKIHAVMGASGGAGTSSVAQNLAFALSERRESGVMLADLDLAYGSTCLNLDVDPGRGLIELLDGADGPDGGSLDAAALDKAMVRRGVHLNVLASRAALEHGNRMSAENLTRIVEVAGATMPQTVLDLPHAWADWIEVALKAADSIVLIATPELCSLRNAQLLLNRLAAIRPNDRPPILVLNQVGVRRRQEVSLRNVSAILKTRPAVSIPFNPALFSQAAADGKLARESGGRSAASRAIDVIAEAVAPRAGPGAGRRMRPRQRQR